MGRDTGLQIFVSYLTVPVPVPVPGSMLPIFVSPIPVPVSAPVPVPVSVSPVTVSAPVSVSMPVPVSVSAPVPVSVPVPGSMLPVPVSVPPVPVPLSVSPVPVPRSVYGKSMKRLLHMSVVESEVLITYLCTRVPSAFLYLEGTSSECGFIWPSHKGYRLIPAAKEAGSITYHVGSHPRPPDSYLSTPTPWYIVPHTHLTLG